MRLFLTLCAACLLTVCNAQSKVGTPDSVKLSRQTAALMFIDAQQKSLLEEKVSRLEEDIANLKAAILSQQKTIAEMDAKDSVQTRIAATYEAELQQRLQQLTAAQAELQRVQKALRSQRRKTKLVAFGGLALATGAGWLFSR